MLTDRAFACLLIAALLLCGAVRWTVGSIQREADATAQRQGSMTAPPSAPSASRHVA